MSNGPKNPGVEIPVMVLSDDELEQARKGEIGKPTEFHCAYCNSAYRISTVALRGRGGRLIGLLFSCPEHLGHIVGHRVQFMRMEGPD